MRPGHANGPASPGLFRAFNRQSGFTLIELLAVIIIIGGVLAVVLPRFAGVGVTYLRSDAGKMATLTRFLSDASATKHVFYRLRFDLDGESIDVSSSTDGETFTAETTPGMRITLSRGVELADITVPGLGTVDSGSVDFFFSPAGAAGPFTLTMRKGDDIRSIRFNPYSGRVVVGEGGE